MDFLPESEKNKWLEEILAKCIEKGWISEAEEVATQLKRDLTTEELEKNFSKMCGRGMVF